MQAARIGESKVSSNGPSGLGFPINNLQESFIMKSSHSFAKKNSNCVIIHEGKDLSSDGIKKNNFRITKKTPNITQKNIIEKPNLELIAKSPHSKPSNCEVLTPKSSKINIKGNDVKMANNINYNQVNHQTNGNYLDTLSDTRSLLIMKQNLEARIESTRLEIETSSQLLREKERTAIIKKNEMECNKNIFKKAQAKVKRVRDDNQNLKIRQELLKNNSIYLQSEIDKEKALISEISKIPKPSLNETVLDETTTAIQILYEVLYEDDFNAHMYTNARREIIRIGRESTQNLSNEMIDYSLFRKKGGIPMEIFDQIPTFDWKNPSNAEGEHNLKDECCSICFAEYEVDQDEIKILPCQHSYHAQCIKCWFKKNATCPICKKQIPSS